MNYDAFLDLMPEVHSRNYALTCFDAVSKPSSIAARAHPPKKHSFSVNVTSQEVSSVAKQKYELWRLQCTERESRLTYE
jgi:hypothetical protein